MKDRNARMRAGDLVISGLFFLLGIYILVGAFRMPLKDSFGGVESMWYVSPALFPIIIGIVIILLSISIFAYALKHNGWEMLKIATAKRKRESLFNKETIRFLAVLVPMFMIVYVDIERMDFFFAVFLYLTFTISVFYLDDTEIYKWVLVIYSFMFLLNIILAAASFQKAFLYSFDVVALLESFILIVTLHKNIRRFIPAEDQPRALKKVRTACLVGAIVPICIEVIFRFGLRVPMPHEGAIMNLLYFVYYAVR